MDTTVGVYGHMATGNMIRAFRRSFEKNKKAKPEKKIVEKSGFEPMKELTRLFISGEISEEVFRKKQLVLAEVGL